MVSKYTTVTDILPPEFMKLSMPSLLGWNLKIGHNGNFINTPKMKIVFHTLRKCQMPLPFKPILKTTTLSLNKLKIAIKLNYSYAH